MRYYLEEEKFDKKKLYVIYEQGKGPDTPVADYRIRIQAIKYLKKLNASPKVNVKW